MTEKSAPDAPADARNGSSPRARRSRKPESPDVVWSKALSKVLRHKARDEGLQLRPDGFVRVDELLARPKFRGLDLATLQRLVGESDKQRFTLVEETTADGQAAWWIKANQGHSLEVEALELRRVLDPAEVPVVLHGTYRRFWPSIAAEGLKCMTRTHIHCAAGRFGDEGVISGVRKTCDLFIYIDVSAAMTEGVTFDVSPNGVILTRGLDGVLPPRFFARVVDRDDRPVPSPATT